MAGEQMSHHILAAMPVPGTRAQDAVIPAMGTVKPLITDKQTAEQTAEYLRRHAPTEDRFTVTSGTPAAPLPVYDMSRIGEKPRESQAEPT